MHDLNLADTSSDARAGSFYPQVPEEDDIMDDELDISLDELH
jgi:hypothetical protein